MRSRFDLYRRHGGQHRRRPAPGDRGYRRSRHRRDPPGAQGAIDDVGKRGEITLIYAGGIRNGADVAKAIALGADAIAIGHSAMMALNCNKDIPEADYPSEMGVEAGSCYHCHTGRCPVGVATQDPDTAQARLDPGRGGGAGLQLPAHADHRVRRLFARACGKTNIHSLEPEDLAALTMEASAIAQRAVGGNRLHTFGVEGLPPYLSAPRRAS